MRDFDEIINIVTDKFPAMSAQGLRKKIGFTMLELKNICKLYNGGKFPKLEVINKLSASLGVIFIFDNGKIYISND